jgi:hypothetical protein
MPGNIRWGTVLLLAVLALLGLSFEAGRRYPFEFLNRFRPRQPVVAAPAFWSLVSTVPQTQFA